MNILVARFNKTQDAEFVAQLIHKLQGNKGKVNVMSEEEWEDYVLGRLAEQSEAEGGTVSRAVIAKHFKKHGVNF